MQDLPHPRAKLYVTLQRVLIHDGLLADLQPGSPEFVDAGNATATAAHLILQPTSGFLYVNHAQPLPYAPPPTYHSPAQSTSLAA